MRGIVPPPVPAPRPRRAADPAAALALVAAAWIAFHGALAYYFSQDDFAALARAAGLVPRLARPERWLSLQLAFDLARPLAGLDPARYHLASLALHAACVVLTYALARRVASRPAAFVGAAAFAVHPALYTALYWISAWGDPMALSLALAALLLALRGDRARWAAVPAFALALAAKESVVGLPLAVVAWRARRVGARAAWRDPLAWALAALSLAISAVVLAPRLGAGAVGPGAPAPYALSVGPHLVTNALTYLGWSVNFWLPTVRAFADATDPSVYAWGAVALALWVAGAFSRGLRDRGWLAGGATYGALLLPVLGLAHHTYHYYLDAPLAGLAVVVAALADAGLARLAPQARSGRGRRAGGSPGGARAWAAAAAVAALLTANGALLVRKIERAPFTTPRLRSDPVVDRARIARRVIEGLRAADLPPGARVRLWSPEAVALAWRQGLPPGRQGYWERNLRAALYGGLAVRVMLPGIREAAFVAGPSPAPDSTWYALVAIDGATEVVTPAELARRGATASPGDAARP